MNVLEHPCFLQHGSGSGSRPRPDNAAAQRAAAAADGPGPDPDPGPGPDPDPGTCSGTLILGSEVLYFSLGKSKRGALDNFSTENGPDNFSTDFQP